MKTKNLTMIVVLAIVVLAIVYDFYAIALGGTEASISHLIIVYSHKYPLIPFLFGILCGHFFWQMKITDDMRKIDTMKKEL